MEKTKYSYYIQTFGCQMNEHDSDRIAGILEKTGCYEAESPLEADVILLNTCCVRAKAEHKVYSEIGKLSLMKEKRDFILGVCGCMAQKERGTITKRFPAVDIVLGTSAIAHIGRAVRRAGKGKKIIDAPSEFKLFDNSLTVLKNDSVKAFITIMEGCDNYCSYCIVPFVRGSERSRPAEDIISEMKKLAEGGIKEIMLLGQNVNSYRSPSKMDCDFSDLLSMADEINGIERIRFVTSHPKDFGKKLVKKIKQLDKVCRNVHLPLQSGSDKILELMNRKYTCGDYMEKIEYLRSEIPDVGISSDIIVGFPGEDEKDFECTMKAVEKIRYDTLFSFNYSHRPPAKSSTLTDDTPDDEKRRRLTCLQALQKKISAEKNLAEEGQVRDVLVEGISKRSASDLTGRTEQNRVVNFRGDDSLKGRIVKVKITKAFSNSLRGEIV